MIKYFEYRSELSKVTEKRSIVTVFHTLVTLFCVETLKLKSDFLDSIGPLSNCRYYDQGRRNWGGGGRMGLNAPTFFQGHLPSEIMCVDRQTIHTLSTMCRQILYQLATFIMIFYHLQTGDIPINWRRRRFASCLISWLV